MHRDAGDIFTGVILEGAWSTMFQDCGAARGWAGYHDTHQVDFITPALRYRSDELPHQAKLLMVTATYLARRWSGHYYAKAQNLRRPLREAYDRALADVDLLAMPTVPQKAMMFDPERTLEEEMFLSGNMSQNTGAFDLSGHPALNMPCGYSEGLPIGMMLVGRHWDEATILRAAAGFEKLGLCRKPDNAGPIS